DSIDGQVEVADCWLQQNIASLNTNQNFQIDGLLIIVFDEGAGNDMAHGGGHIPAVIVSPKAKKGYKSTTFYQHQSTLRLILHGLGITSYPGNASSAPEMGEFF